MRPGLLLRGATEQFYDNYEIASLPPGLLTD
jgi:hypothetical protein